MKVKEVLNTFFHVYAINVIVITFIGYFFGLLYRAFTLNKNNIKKCMYKEVQIKNNMQVHIFQLLFLISIYLVDICHFLIYRFILIRVNN